MDNLPEIPPQEPTFIGDTGGQPFVKSLAPKLDGAVLARRIEEAPTLPQKAALLWSLPTRERHAALGALSAETVAALVESNLQENTALLGNLPSEKFVEIVNLGAPDLGRRWLERAVSSRMLAAQILPALLPPRDLMLMLMTASEFRGALSGLLNFRRAEQMRSLLHPLEWKKSLNDLLLADAEELLHKAPIKDRNLRTVLQSLVDFYPELYLDVVRQALDYAKYQEDRGEQLADILEMPFAMPEFLNEEQAPTPAAAATAESITDSREAANSSALNEIVPTGRDPFLNLATSSLPVDRRDQLEAELRDLLRREIVATGSFSENDLLRASGRLLFQLRAGLYQLGGTTPGAASSLLLTKSFNDIVLVGARVAERYRQRALQLAGVKDWLDRSQKQFLGAMNTLEPGVDPQSGEPTLYLPSRTNQPRDEWQPSPLADVDAKLDEIAAWSGLARAAFGTPARVQSIFASLKTKSAAEAVRRTVIALCLYRRWEPELVNPGEDFVPFKKEFSDDLGRLILARQMVNEAVDATPAEAWKPADTKERARAMLLRGVDALERPGKREKPEPRTGDEEIDEEEV